MPSLSFFFFHLRSLLSHRFERCCARSVFVNSRMEWIWCLSCVHVKEKKFSFVRLRVYQKVNIYILGMYWCLDVSHKMPPTMKTMRRPTFDAMSGSRMHAKSTKVPSLSCWFFFFFNVSLSLSVYRVDFIVNLVCYVEQGIPVCLSRLRLWPAVSFTMRIAWESHVVLPKGTFYLFKHIHIKLKKTVNTHLPLCMYRGRSTDWISQTMYSHF